MQVQWKNERVPDKTAVCVCVCVCFLLQRSCSNWLDAYAHADLELC